MEPKKEKEAKITRKINSAIQKKTYSDINNAEIVKNFK